MFTNAFCGKWLPVFGFIFALSFECRNKEAFFWSLAVVKGKKGRNGEKKIKQECYKKGGSGAGTKKITIVKVPVSHPNSKL